MRVGGGNWGALSGRSSSGINYEPGSGASSLCPLLTSENLELNDS